MSGEESKKEDELSRSLSEKKIKLKALATLTLSSIAKLPVIKTKNRPNNLNYTVSNSLAKANLKKQLITETVIPENETNSNSIKYDISNSKFHNRNLEYIRQIASKLDSNRRINLTKIHRKTPMERYNKIKKKFLLYINEKNGNEMANGSLLEEKKLIIPKIEIKEPENKIFYYRIDKGNNMKLIKQCFEHRTNWMDYRKTDSSITEADLNFMWCPTSNLINYNLLSNEPDNKNLTMSNHFEHHGQISNKLKMFINIMEYTENRNIDIFSFIPLTIVIEYENNKFLGQFAHFSHIFNHIEEFINESSNYKDIKKKYRDYFYATNNVDCKIGLKTPIYIPKSHYDGKNLWLLKALNLNRGRCIKIIDNVESCEIFIKNFYNGILKNFKDSENNKEIEAKDNRKKIIYTLPKIRNREYNIGIYHQIDYYKLLNNVKEKNKQYQSSKLVLQKYIEKPLLYNKRKFDMRIWVLLNHKMEAYIFKEGHLKATSYEYDSQSKNSFIHLTNYSVQKYSENFSKFEYGNEISFSEFEESLLKDYGIEKNVKKDIYPKLIEIIKISLDAVKDKINDLNRRGCYELLGYDFMFDENINPFLIEINTNPGLEISSPLISQLVPRMVDDCFRLTIDDVFGVKYKEDRFVDGKFVSPFHVDGYDDSENMFEKIADFGEKKKKKIVLY